MAKMRQYGQVSLVLLLAAVLIIVPLVIIGVYLGRRGPVPTAEFALPYIYIETQNKLPTNNTDYVNCSFQLTNTADADDACTVTMKKRYGAHDSVGIRLRGNSTQWFDKKPYRIEFDQKQSFFGSAQNKSWVLLAEYLDPSDMRNYTAFELASRFENLAYTPSRHHVVLYLNGNYQGVYLLTDQVDEGRLGVATDFDVATDTEFPFYVEMGQDNPMAGGVYGRDYFNVDGFEPVAIKYPAADERGSGDKVYRYIQEYMTTVAKLLQNGNQAVAVSFRAAPVTLADLVDEASLIDFYLVQEIMGNWDASQKSIKMYKTQNGKLTFGPVWDFDCCAIPGWTGKPGQAKNDLSIANRLEVVDSPVPVKWLALDGNRERFYDRFMAKRDDILAVVTHLQAYYAEIAPAAAADAAYWYGTGGAEKFTEQYQFLQDYLTARATTLTTLLRP